MGRAGAVLVFAVVAACGGTDGATGDTLPAPAVSIDGDWVATALTVGGVDVAVNPPTVSMSIVGDQVTGVAACNSYGGTLDIGDDGSFALEGLAITEMACEPADVMATEAAVLDAFAAIGRYALGGELTLSSGDGATSMTLVRIEIPATTVAAGALSLDGTWTAVGANVDGVEIGESDLLSVTMAVGGGRITGSNGCNTYATAIEVAGDTITFGATEATEAGCTGPPGEIEGLFQALTNGTATWTIEGDALTLVNAGATWVFTRTGDAPALTTTATTTAPTVPATAPLPDPLIVGTQPVPSATVPAALATGVLQFVNECLLLDVSGVPSVIVWPAGVSWQATPPAVVYPDGTVVPVGAIIDSAAAYASGATGDVVLGPDDLALAERCRVDGSELVVLYDIPTVFQPDAAGGLDGPVMFASSAAPPVAVEDTAVGTLFLGDNCLGIMRDDGVTIALVIWPYGTRWQQDGSGVVLPSGEVLGFGPVVLVDGAVIEDGELGRYTESQAVGDEITRCRRTEQTLLFVAA